MTVKQKSEAKRIWIGCAGWSIPKANSGNFSTPGTHLSRYAREFNAVEINSSFYRPHRRTTYERWANSTPDHFKFSVKIPKIVTHQKKLVQCELDLTLFTTQTEGLGEKLGAYLVQLPPSLKFDEVLVGTFFAGFRKIFSGQIFCEARNESWFSRSAVSVLSDFKVGQVFADPSPWTAALRKTTSEAIYWRLHGSPRVYYSNYELEYLSKLGKEIELASAREIWTIFDNTAGGFAVSNALTLKARIRSESGETTNQS